MPELKPRLECISKSDILQFAIVTMLQSTFVVVIFAVILWFLVHQARVLVLRNKDSNAIKKKNFDTGTIILLAMFVETFVLLCLLLLYNCFHFKEILVTGIFSLVLFWFFLCYTIPIDAAKSHADTKKDWNYACVGIVAFSVISFYFFYRPNTSWKLKTVSFCLNALLFMAIFVFIAICKSVFDP